MRSAGSEQQLLLIRTEANPKDPMPYHQYTLTMVVIPPLNLLMARTASISLSSLRSLDNYFEIFIKKKKALHSINILTAQDMPKANSSHSSEQSSNLQQERRVAQGRAMENPGYASRVTLL